jgi:hypothetical protein
MAKIGPDLISAGVGRFCCVAGQGFEPWEGISRRIYSPLHTTVGDVHRFQIGPSVGRPGGRNNAPPRDTTLTNDE